MKVYKLLVILLSMLISLTTVQAQQKYALVIGNGAYQNLTRLNNPVNDANDMKAVLQGLGFNVDTVVNGSRVQMEEAIERFKNWLSVTKNSYGFLFYAGHGVQSGGINYLIPADADIRSESYLGDRAVSVQAMLNEINQAGNELNVVVLDACRDNPFSWSQGGPRGGPRGLQVVGNQPADSIIVYATSAGSTAADGAGRNGLFTSHLLNNLQKPGLEISEVFRLTGGDVARVSSGNQRPAVYNQFYGTAYLGTKPAAVVPQPTPQPTPKQDKQEAVKYYNSGNAYYNKGDYDRAIADYNQAIRLNPNYAAAYFNRGDAYYDKGDYDRAIADYNQAIWLDPNYAAAYNNRDIAYAIKEQFDEFIEFYTQMIRFRPNDAIAYNNRGWAYYNKKDYDRAIEDYNQAIRLNPNLAMPYNDRGGVYYNKKDYDRAIEDYNQAIRLNPNYAYAYNNRGIAYWNKGNKTQARADWTRALQLDPNNTAARNNLEMYYEQ